MVRACLVLVVVMLSGMAGPIGLAAAADAAEEDATDRSMAFIEKSVEATNLYNERRLSEALAAFDDLLRNYGDLDEDGLVAMGMADCLFAMERYDEARRLYQVIAGSHPASAAAVNLRVREIDLVTGAIDDAMLAELRQAAAASEHGDHLRAQVQLGRALQKRAAVLLTEAANVFRFAAEGRSAAGPGSRRLLNQAVMLAEIQEDLAWLVDRVDASWAADRTLGQLVDEASLEDAEADVRDCRLGWRSVEPQGAARDCEINWAGNRDVRLTIDGRPVELDANAALVIRRHLERIDAVVRESRTARTAAR